MEFEELKLSNDEIIKLLEQGYRIIKTELIGLTIYVYWEYVN